MFDLITWFYLVLAFLGLVAALGAVGLLTRWKAYTKKDLKLLPLLAVTVFLIRVFFHVFFWVIRDSNDTSWYIDVARYLTTPEYQFSAALRSVVMHDELMTYDPIHSHWKFWLVEAVVFGLISVFWSLPIFVVAVKPSGSSQNVAEYKPPKTS